MKYQVMEYKDWDAPVKVLGDVSAATPGAAIRLGVRRWPQLHADNFFLKPKDWTTWQPARDVVKPIMMPPGDDPYA